MSLPCGPCLMFRGFSAQNLRTDSDSSCTKMGSCISYSHLLHSKLTLKIAADLSHIGASFLEIRELLLHTFFMVMLGFFTFGVYTQNSYHLNYAIANSFIHRHYYCEDERTDIFNVSSVDELWCYLNNRFVVTLTEHPFWGDMGTKNETLLLRHPRIRQVRVVKEDCIIPVTKHGCFREFSKETQETSPFNLANGTAWVYNPPEKMGDIWFTGKVSNYNSAGYFFELTDASQLLFYKENNWIDQQTRALFIDFTFYNININLFCVCQVMFELPPSGGIIPTYLFSTVKLFRYNNHYDHVVLACEIVFAVLCIHYTIELFCEMAYFKGKFLRVRDNWIDLPMLSLSWASVWVLIYRYISSSPILQNDAIRGIQELTDHQHLKYIHLTADRVTAVTLFCSFLKLYRFFHLDTISQIYTTLQYCFMDMVSFCFLFFIILFAYAELGTLLFSNYVESYKTIAQSSFTLLRIMMGEFHYQDITRALSLIGPVYIVSFVMFVVFLLLNMFLAIINATYSVVSSNIKVTRKSEYGPFICHCLGIKWKRFRPKPKEKIQTMNNSDKISQMMKNSGFSELETDTFFSRHTVDNRREIPEEVFKGVVHQNVGMPHLLKLKARTKLIHNSVEEVIKKKDVFLDKVSHLMRT